MPAETGSLRSSAVTDQSKTLVRNLTSLTTANLIAHIVTGLVSVLVANHLGKQGYGEFRIALAFATVFLMFAETGVGARFLYDRSGDKTLINEHYGSMIFLQAAPYTAIFFVTMAMAFVFRYPAVIIWLIGIVSAAAIFRIFGEVCEKVLNVYQEIHLTAIMRSVRFFSIAVGGVAVLVFNLGPVAWALINLGAMFLSAAATFFTTLKYARPRFVRSLYWPTLVASYPFGLGAIFYAIYENVDQVMLSKLMPVNLRDETVGIYGAAYTVMMFTYVIPSSFIASIEPIVFGARDNDHRLAHIGSLASRALGVIGLPLTLGTILLSGQIGALALPSFGPTAGKALAALAPFGLFRFLNFPGGMLLAAVGMQRRRVIVQAGAVVFNIALNFVVIPYYGLFGAAWATVATEIYIFICYEVSLVRRLPGYGEFKRLVRPLIATAIMSAFVLAAVYAVGTPAGRAWFGWMMLHHKKASIDLSWLLIVPFAAALYFGFLKTMGFFTDEEMTFFGRVLDRFTFWRRRA
jgi:O-antigen/teichoic acid export membrane protein